MEKGLRAGNLAELYREAAERFGDRPAFATRGAHKRYEMASFAELYEQGLAVATALIHRGLGAREHVAVLSDNRFEWIVTDCALQTCGAASVPRGRDVTDAEILYILPHAEARFAFVEDAALAERVQSLRGSLPGLELIVVLDPCAEPSDSYLRLADLVVEGRALRSSGDRLAEARVASIRPDDLFTLIYTSGTTGIPKGVMLTHQSMISQVRLVPIKVTPRDRAIAILPIWHILERVYEMILIAGGACVYYSSIRTLKEDFAEVRPTLMVSAPRLWESVYQGILANVNKQPPVRQALFSAAYYSARKVQTARRYLAGRRLKLTRPPAHRVWLGGLWHGIVATLFLVPYLALDPLVLRKLRAALGGQLQSTLSGGGALPRQVDEFFNNIGIPVQEGYGLTETCPVLSVRTGKGMVIGTVGPLIPQTELRLLDLETREVLYPPHRGVMGEVHVRGPQVMAGYYKDPEGTARVLSDGWLNTGDLGIVTHNGCLRIVGRSKDTIVLLGGENVEPAPIENALRESPLIDQCMVVGQDRKTLGALVVPRQSALRAYGEDLEALAQSEEARQAVMRDIRHLVSRANGFKGFELVTNCRLLPKPFEIGDELTNLFKLRRKVVAEKYADLIQSLYQ